MRWSLLTVRLVIAAVSIVTALILILTVIPLASGGLEINVHEGQDIRWAISGDNVSAQYTVSIRNGGYFDIEGFTLSVNVTDVDGTHLSTSSSVPTDLKAGAWTDVVLPIRIDLGSLTAEKKADIIFNGTEVMMGIGLDSYFGLRLIHLSVAGAGNQTMQIQPLITDLSVDPTQMTLESSGGGYVLVQPYSFGASDMITGRELDLAVVVRNRTSEVSTVTQSMTLESQNSGELRLPLTQAEAQALMLENTTLTIAMTATMEGVSFTQSVVYEWTAPITNLQIYRVGLSGTDMAVEYGFQASSQVTGRSAVVAMTVSDSVGQIGQGTDMFTISSNNHRTMTVTVSPSAAARLVGTEKDLLLTFDVTVSSITLHLTRTYHWTGGA